jgi:hypothetical protein
MFADIWLQTGLISRDVRIFVRLSLSKEKDAQVSPTDIRGACQLSEDGEYHRGVSHIYRCGNRHTIGQLAHQQRDLQFDSFFASNSSRMRRARGAHANCL